MISSIPISLKKEKSKKKNKILNTEDTAKQEWLPPTLKTLQIKITHENWPFISNKPVFFLTQSKDFWRFFLDTLDQA